MNVNIYIETSFKGPATRRAAGAWIVEYITFTTGRPVTRGGIIYSDRTTENDLALCLIEKAFSILTKTCCAVVFTECGHVLRTMQNHWLAQWQKNGWTNAKGNPIRNAEAWNRCALLLEHHMEEWTDRPHEYRQCIYRGSNLLWKREVPKYMFLSGNLGSFHRPNGTVYSLDAYGSSLCTSDALKTLSAFIDCPSNMSTMLALEDNTAKRGAFLDIEYAFDKYFALVVIGERINGGSNFENTYHICYSDDGYSWRKIQSVQFGDVVPTGIKRYVYGNIEVLAIISQNEILFLDSEYNLRTVFSFSDTYDSGNTIYGYSILSKNGTLIIAPRQFGVRIVAHGENFTAIRDIQDKKWYSNTSDDGKFYMLKGSPGTYREYCEILSSSDGNNWSSFKKNLIVFPDGKMEGKVSVYVIYVLDGYLYILSTYSEDEGIYEHPFAMRVNLRTGSAEERLFDDVLKIIGSCFAINGEAFFMAALDSNDRYCVKYKDIFDESEEGEIVRITCQFKSSSTLAVLQKIVSSDYEADITV